MSSQPSVDPLAVRSRLSRQFASSNHRESVVRLLQFCLAYASLTFFGYGLREQHGALTIVWPSAGLLLVSLFLVPVRQWVWVLVAQVGIELLVDWTRATQFQPLWSVVFALADSVDAIVGATLARRFIAAAALPRIRQVVIFVAAAATGAGVSALIGATAASAVLSDSDYSRQWQIWWAGNFLGSLAIAPVALTWVIRWRLPDMSVTKFRAIEIALLGLLLLGMTDWIFSTRSTSMQSILQLPFTLLVILVVAAFRLPPRWATAYAAGAILMASWFAAQGFGPFAGDPNPFVRVGTLQVFCATLAVVTFMLSTVLLERQRSNEELMMAEQRYRSFVAHSSEAVWRIELTEPMPMGLTTPEQIQWLKQHAIVAECNLGYQHLQESQLQMHPDAKAWQADVPWSAVYLEHLEEASEQGYSMEGLQFVLKTQQSHEVYLANFNGVIDRGCLVRIWGVARNITEIVALNDRLRREQQRLQSYARQLAGSEERARRATAVDLHDGIGQLLVGLGMNIDAASAHAPAVTRGLLDEMRIIVRQIQESTKQIISDLSPPGLYELGLGPALQWLAVYMRSRDQLHVTVDLNVNEKEVNIDLRVLIFKIIRELLRNVAKHARVKEAAVKVVLVDAQVIVEVTDQGVGFEWQLDLFTELSAGFGLFSIVDRVQSANGKIAVNTAPGKGCQVSISFPLAAYAGDVTGLASSA